MKKLFIGALSVLLFTASAASAFASNFKKTEGFINSQISIKIVNVSDISDSFYLLSTLPVQPTGTKLNFTYENFNETESNSVQIIRHFVEAAGFVTLICTPTDARETFRQITNQNIEDICK